MNKTGIFLTIAGVCLVLSGVIFYYNNIIIPGEISKAEEKLRIEIDDKAMPKKRVAVIHDPSGISKHTVITDDIINSKIKMVNIPVKYTAQNVVVDVDLIRGKIAKEDMRFGEQIVLDSLSIEEKWFGEYERLREYKVRNVVAGEVKTGNIIDVLVNYGNGDYDIVVSKTKVRKLITGDEVNSKSDGNDSRDYTIIIAVDEVAYRDLELAQRLGILETRLYLDDSQPSSKKTFDYHRKIEKLQLTGNTNKLEQSGDKSSTRQSIIRAGE